MLKNAYVGSVTSTRVYLSSLFLLVTTKTQECEINQIFAGVFSLVSWNVTCALDRVSTKPSNK